MDNTSHELDRMNTEGPIPALGWSVRTRVALAIFGTDEWCTVTDDTGRVVALCREETDARLVLAQHAGE